MVRRIKILLMLEATVGGAYRHVLQLALFLPKTEFDVSVVLSPLRGYDCDSDAGMLEQNGARCLFIPMTRGISLTGDMKAFMAIRRLLREQHYDIVHTHSSKAGLLGRIAAYLHGAVRIVHTPHCFFFQGKKGVAKWFMKIPERLLARITDCIIAVSDSEKALAEEERITAHDRIYIIKNAVLPGAVADEDTKARLRKQYDIPEGKKVIAGVGRLTHQKDWATFVHIAAEIVSRRNDVHFLIAGDGEERKRLETLIGKSGLQPYMTMAGYCRRMEEVYSITDVLLHTSLWEGMPYALLEAMAYRIPVAATAVPGNADIISPGRNGYLFSIGRHMEGGRQVEILLDDEQLRSKTGNAGYEYAVTHHSPEVFVRLHRQLYHRLAVIEEP